MWLIAHSHLTVGYFVVLPFAEPHDQQHILAYFLVSFDSHQAADGLTGLGAIIGKAFLYIACVISDEHFDSLATHIADMQIRDWEIRPISQSPP